jgi:hypothetical protein
LNGFDPIRNARSVSGTRRLQQCRSPSAGSPGCSHVDFFRILIGLNCCTHADKLLCGEFDPESGSW